jgi:CheY-like chemotaxis protein
MLVLIVDDDLDDQALFAEALCAVNAKATHLAARNGQEALMVLKSLVTLPEIIFLDLNMPVMDGRQFLSEINSVPLLADIPCVVFSTSIKGREQSLFELGAFAVHSKPTSYAELLKIIETNIVKLGL